MSQKRGIIYTFIVSAIILKMSMLKAKVKGEKDKI